MARTLNRAVLAGGVIYPAGTAATNELEDAIPNADFWTGEASAPGEESQGYASQTAAELKAEIDRRNEGREEDALISKTGKKADLIAALEADDAAAAQPTPESDTGAGDDTSAGDGEGDGAGES